MIFLPQVAFVIFYIYIKSFFLAIFFLLLSFFEPCQCRNTKILKNQVNSSRISRHLCKQTREQHFISNFKSNMFNLNVIARTSKSGNFRAVIVYVVETFFSNIKKQSYSIAAQYLLFDFGFKKLFNKKLAFPPLYRDFYRLLLATSKDHLVWRMLFVL